MADFGKFYLDKEKDILVTLDLSDGKMTYVIHTPNHGTGNLISNLAKLTGQAITFDETGMKVICGNALSFVDGNNKTVFVMRLGGTKVANIYPDGTVERKAYIPAIAKTLMSQTKDYSQSLEQTLVKTYIRSEVKFHTDLHSHRSANLSPDVLIALGIHHQLNYPYYYVKKLKLAITDKQREEIEERRKEVAKDFEGSTLTGKYLDRKIDDNTEVNFADLILNNIENAATNIPKIRASLSILKDGQAVFTNLEKVYLYRYVFAKGRPARTKVDCKNYDDIDDVDIVSALHQMEKDRKNPHYANNSLYQDKLLWTARNYARVGVTYAEISDTALVKESEAAHTLAEIHEVMPYVTKETGVTLRFLGALRRIPLTIVKDATDKSNYFCENLRVLKAVAGDPYIAGSDFVGEEINDIRELQSVIAKVVEIANDNPGFVVRIHAGENDSLPDNCLNSVICVEQALAKGQPFPTMRIGHGLYTAKLSSKKGQQLLDRLRRHDVVLEFQITSNVRLNNLSEMKNHPLKQYLSSGISCVQGTDGGAIYGSDSMDEQLSLEKMLDLTYEDLLKMRAAEDKVLAESMKVFAAKKRAFSKECADGNVEKYINARIAAEADSFKDVVPGSRKYDAASFLADRIGELPEGKVPVVIAGGSFNNATHVTRVTDSERAMLDDLLKKTDPGKAYFVIGSSLSGHEQYIFEHGKDRFEIFAYVPAAVTAAELKKLKESGVKIRVSLETSPLGVYKSIAFEVFKRRKNVFLAMDGNSAADNLIQDAKNSKYLSYRFVNTTSKGLRSKAQFLQGYVTMWNGGNADEIVKVINDFYDNPDE